MGSADHVPETLDKLKCATSKVEAERLYWKLDNCVVVQGALYEASVPTVICALTTLQRCTDIARPYILELLQIIGSGEAATTEIENGNSNIYHQCMREIHHGTSVFFDLLEFGSTEERLLSVDLLYLCCGHDKSLIERVVWWFEWLQSQGIASKDVVYIRRCLSELNDPNFEIQ